MCGALKDAGNTLKKPRHNNYLNNKREARVTGFFIPGKLYSSLSHVVMQYLSARGRVHLFFSIRFFQILKTMLANKSTTSGSVSSRQKSNNGSIWDRRNRVVKKWRLLVADAGDQQICYFCWLWTGIILFIQIHLQVSWLFPPRFSFLSFNNIFGSLSMVVLSILAVPLAYDVI